MLVQLNCYNRMCVVIIFVNLVDGYMLGQVFEYLENIVSIELFDNVLIDYKGELQLYQEVGNLFVYVFMLVFVVIYLILVV